MDFGAAFSYMLKDADWVKKLLIGAVFAFFSFLLIPGVFLAGYFVKATRNIASGEERPLPEWDNWGDLFVSGIKYNRKPLWPIYEAVQRGRRDKTC